MDGLPVDVRCENKHRSRFGSFPGSPGVRFLMKTYKDLLVNYVMRVYSLEYSTFFVKGDRIS